MILMRQGCLAIFAGLALTSTPASADVMQIDSGGARWVSGALAGASANPVLGPAPKTPQLNPNYAVPDGIIADPARQAEQIPEQYAAKVRELATRYDLSPTLIEALVWQESRWQPDAVSPVGARGLAQLMPGTAAAMGVDPSDPYANLEGGARYLRMQLNRFNGDLEKALAAYNAGPGRVERANGIPRIRETQNYVASVIGRLSNHSRSTR